MRFLVDRCAGRRLAEWLSGQGHDVLEARSLGPDPGDAELLSRAAADGRVLVTMDKDFGQFLFEGGAAHAGLVRLPDVPAAARIELMAQVVGRHREDLAQGAIVTVRRGRVRISRPAMGPSGEQS